MKVPVSVSRWRRRSSRGMAENMVRVGAREGNYILLHNTYDQQGWEQMSDNNLEVLIVEDNPGDAFIIEEMLLEIGVEINIKIVEDGLEAVNLLKNKWERRS